MSTNNRPHKHQLNPRPGPRFSIPCPVRRGPLFDVVPAGIEIRCRSCRGTTHRISRAFLEQVWQELAVSIEPQTGG